jgi:DNA-binding MarR family transcriptional regulator
MEDQSAQWPIGRLLAAASRAVEREWDERLRAIGLQHAALIALDIALRNGPTGADVIARTARVQPQTMSRTLERLERDGMIERSPHPEDGRRRLVTVTDHGRQTWETARHVEREILPDDPELRARLGAILAGTRRPDSDVVLAPDM